MVVDIKKLELLSKYLFILKFLYNVKCYEKIFLV